jgi:membrane-associated HD superfamily phosphohydrolase
LKLAKRHRLPRPIADFIPEHQGTLKMGFFLHKARQINPNIEERRFRYHGPSPRSKETGILMLADGCEAALRSLPPDTSEAEAKDTVRRSRMDNFEKADCLALKLSSWSRHS